MCHQNIQTLWVAHKETCGERPDSSQIRQSYNYHRKLASRYDLLLEQSSSMSTDAPSSSPTPLLPVVLMEGHQTSSTVHTQRTSIPARKERSPGSEAHHSHQALLLLLLLATECGGGSRSGSGSRIHGRLNVARAFGSQ